MTDFDAKWKADCDAFKAALIRTRNRMSDEEVQRGKLISNLKPFIDYYRKDHDIPADTPLEFLEGKEVINSAIWEQKSRAERYARAPQSSEDFGRNVRLLEAYRDSF